MPNEVKHWFLQPSMSQRRYICGGWQIFNRMAELVGRTRDAEVLTYRQREDGFRYLDDVPSSELESGILWVSWQSHVTELAERLAGRSRVVLYAQNIDFGKQHGQVTPPAWPIVCLSRYIAADYALRDPWRLIYYLGPVLHPSAVNHGAERDIDVLLHVRKNVPYLMNELAPALKESVKVEVLDKWLSQEEFFAYLNRSKTYLYWMHKQIPSLWIPEGFGMQPLEAIACGATPVSNFYGGLGDYLIAPYNCQKIGVHSLEYDVKQIVNAVREHDGTNPDEEHMRHFYGEEMFSLTFDKIERNLLFYFQHCPQTPPQDFAIEPPRPPLSQRPYNWLYQQVWRQYRAIKKIRPT